MTTLDRYRTPPLGPDPELVLPDIGLEVLPNGLSVRTVRHGQMPAITAALVIPAGSAVDPPDRPGLAAFTADMADEGAGSRSMLELHDALARLGGQLDIEIGPDGVAVVVTTLARHAERGLDLLADIVMRPRNEPADIERVRDLRLSRLSQLHNVPGAVADRSLSRVLYGTHPYGHVSLGSEAALRAIDREAIERFHTTYWRPAGASLVVAGAIEPGMMTEAVHRAFGGWAAAPPSALPDLPEPGSEEAQRAFLIPRPGAPQSEVRVAYVAETRYTTDFHGLLVLNAIAGGQFVSRINLNLREDKGYTYGARSGFDFRRQRGPFVVQASVQTDATAASVHEILSELRGLGSDRPATDDEVERAKASLTRG